ncbi:hypothetical protein L581_0829 [Serratia fonticola AU-AP2C]|nr:hypothetical protein L581_0829 [Serratia fonticola AU-AP2C]
MHHRLGFIIQADFSLLIGDPFYIFSYKDLVPLISITPPAGVAPDNQIRNFQMNNIIAICMDK